MTRITFGYGCVSEYLLNLGVYVRGKTSILILWPSVHAMLAIKYYIIPRMRKQAAIAPPVARRSCPVEALRKGRQHPGKGTLGSSTHASLNFYLLNPVHASLNFDNLSSVYASLNVGLPIGIVLQTSEDCMQTILCQLITAFLC